MSLLFRVDTVVTGSVWGARATITNAFLFGFILSDRQKQVTFHPYSFSSFTRT